MNTNLYNNDGTLSAQAQSLLSPKPADISMSEWKKLLKEFRSQLSIEDLNEFNKTRQNKIGNLWPARNPEKLKACSSAWYANNSEKAKITQKSYYQRNKEKIKQRTKAYQQVRKRNKEKESEYQKAYREANKQKESEYQKAYRKSNKQKRRVYMRAYHKNRRHEDPLYKFFYNIRIQAVRVVKQIGLGKKPASTFKWVGCSPEELKSRFESLFAEGMSWDNYGEWHVDHIRPVSSFKPEEWEQINHYTNLQPLWAEDNLKKSDNYSIEQQEKLLVRC